MGPTERGLLEEIRSDVRELVTAMPALKAEARGRDKHLADLEVRVRALEEKVTRLTVIAGAAGGVVGALLGAGVKALFG